ncbi:hypothetical protein F4861DRAFT_110739 [Xylaria intraflava]|nr:hypothetical protein F4861DRAFT_110739 [Xylaria intraflava]
MHAKCNRRYTQPHIDCPPEGGGGGGMFKPLFQLPSHRLETHPALLHSKWKYNHPSSVSICLSYQAWLILLLVSINYTRGCCRQVNPQEQIRDASVFSRNLPLVQDRTGPPFSLIKKTRGCIRKSTGLTYRQSTVDMNLCVDCRPSTVGRRQVNPVDYRLHPWPTRPNPIWWRPNQTNTTNKHTRAKTPRTSPSPKSTHDPRTIYTKLTRRGRARLTPFPMIHTLNTGPSIYGNLSSILVPR